MTADIIAQQIEVYAPVDAVDQENLLAEMLQHYVLSSLARSGFFDVAAFHGGTFLRIVHGMDRFSEDLDFVLKEKDEAFRWEAFLNRVIKECAFDGISFDVTDRSDRTAAVQKAVLNTPSTGTCQRA